MGFRFRQSKLYRDRVSWTVLMLLLLCAACSTQVAPDTSLITGTPCAPPCWQRITPGGTMTEEQVLQILKSLPNVNEPWKPIDSTIAWYWKQPAERKTASNSVTLENDQIKHILLSVDFELTVKQIIDKYGIPDAVIAGKAGLPEDRYVRLDLLYPMRGLTFSAKMLPLDSPVLEPSTKIYEAQFAMPAESLVEWKSSNNDRGLHSWPGYGRIDVP